MTHSCGRGDGSGAINCVNPDSQVTEIPIRDGSKRLRVLLSFCVDRK